MAGAGALLLGLALAGCQTPVQRPAAPDSVSDTEQNATAVLSRLEAGHGGLAWPAGPELVRTTSAEIYLGNLDSRIEVLEQRQDSGALRELAELRWYRFGILGRLDDLEAALELAEAALARNADRARPLMVRGSIYGTLHRFEEARRDLLEAARTETDAHRTLNELDLGEGRYRELSQTLAARDPGAEGLYELALRGNFAVTRGDAAEAEKWFRQAQLHFRDVSPVPLAWLHTQQGIAWLRFGEVQRAHGFFEAAYRRLPRYYLAAEHLAEAEFLLGRPERAREIYLEVIEQTGMPEFIAALAAVEAELGADDDAARLERLARQRFDELVKRHPAAFAEHAARFHLDQGEGQTALELARLNLESRRDVMAWLLLAEAAHAAGKPREACRALGRARRTGMNPPELAEITAGLDGCAPGRAFRASR